MNLRPVTFRFVALFKPEFYRLSRRLKVLDSRLKFDAEFVKESQAVLDTTADPIQLILHRELLELALSDQALTERDINSIIDRIANL